MNAQCAYLCVHIYIHMSTYMLYKFISKYGSVQHTQLPAKGLLIIIYLFHAFAADFMTMLAIIFVELMYEHTYGLYVLYVCTYVCIYKWKLFFV